MAQQSVNIDRGQVKNKKLSIVKAPNKIQNETGKCCK
jgi:hypothetical protein